MRLFQRTLHALAATATLLVLLASWATAQESTANLDDDAPSMGRTGPTIRPVRTDNPRDTLATLLRLRGELEDAFLDYGSRRTVDGAEHIKLLAEQLRALLDLEEVASASRREVGNDTIAYLLDIFGRVELPNLADVPDADAFEDEGLAQYRIPKTPIRITRIEDGPRDGEFLFNGRTVRVAPRFYRGIEDLPLNSTLGIRSWSEFEPQITGPLIPAAVVRAMPQAMRGLWMDTPFWKAIAVIVIAVVEWAADTVVNEPMIETVMIGFNGSNSISLIRTGTPVDEK